METFLTFPTDKQARLYRFEHGTGGWIFAPESESFPTVLFPPHYTPVDIFRHPFTLGRNGRLIGSQ